MVDIMEVDTDAAPAADPFQTEARTLLLKFDANSSCVRNVHFGGLPTSLPERPSSKTLLLTQVPPWATPESLQRLFSDACGSVKAVYFDRHPVPTTLHHTVQDPSLWPPPDVFGAKIRGVKCAHVVFDKASSYRSALQTMDVTTTYVLSTPDHPVATGLRKWKREYNAVLLHKKQDLDNLAENIKTYVEEMDKAKEELRKKAAMEAEPDDEGWVTVSRHSGKSRKPLGKATDKGQAKIKARDAKRRKRKELLDFYRFQTKEEKMDRLKELKEKFEGDRQKQIKMKQDRQQRKFKPS